MHFYLQTYRQRGRLSAESGSNLFPHVFFLVPPRMRANTKQKAVHCRSSISIVEAAQELKEYDLLERARLASSLGLMIRAMWGALCGAETQRHYRSIQLSSIDDVEHYKTILRGIVAHKSVPADMCTNQPWVLLRQDLPRFSDEFFSLLKYV